MAQDVPDRLFHLDKEANNLTELEETTYAELGLYETRDLHEWLADRIDMLGDDLFVIQREHAAIAETRRRPDIVALDGSGRIVVVEVKRETGEAGVVWQSILYASYYGPYSPSDVVEMYRAFAEIETNDAEAALLQHLDAEDLADVNSGQRIIMVAPSFAPEVTNAALWLRDNSIDVSCIELKPYRGHDDDDVYVHLNVVIPLPTRADVGVTRRKVLERQEIIGARASRRDDAVTAFMNQVREKAFEELDEEIQPTKWSRYAGAAGTRRWYILYYEHVPWVNHHFCFRVWKETGPQAEVPGEVAIEFYVWRKGVTDQGASDEQLKAAYEAAKALGRQTGWEFSEPPQAKSFLVFHVFPEEESSDPALVADVLAELIREVAPLFQTGDEPGNDDEAGQDA